MAHKNNRTNSTPKQTAGELKSDSTKGRREIATISLSPSMRGALWTLAFILFAAYAFYLLVGKNAEYLYAVQEHSLFVADRSFWDDKMMYVGGFAQWLGCYLTQFFYYPWLGASLLLVCWAIIYVLFIKTFDISLRWVALVLIPLCALLVSEVDLGYWLYYLKQPGYWFTQTVSIIIALLATFIYKYVGRTNRRSVLWQSANIILAVALLYPVVGYWALAAAVWMSIMTVQNNPRHFVPLIVAVASIIVVPLLSYQFYTRMRLEDAWLTGFPLFQNDSHTSWALSLPFLIVSLCPIIFIFLPRTSQAVQKEISRHKCMVFVVVNVLILAASFPLADRLAYDNYNYKAELRIYRAVDESRWGDVLSELKRVPGDITRQMVISKNIALMHNGTCGNEMFRYLNTGEPPYVRDSLAVHLVQTCGPQVYYNYGRCNFACRWAIENSVEFGYDVNNLKTLVRTSMMSKEWRAAQKYLNILHNTTFQRQWAAKWQAMLDDHNLYYQSVEYKNVYPMTLFRNTLDGDEGLVEMYIINYFSHVHKRTPKFQEQTLVYALIQKDISLFWPRFFAYATLHEGQPMPIHYQEAAYLYGNLEHEVDISGMPFDPNRIKSRYASFNQMTQQLLSQGMSVEQVGRATQSTFGDTFWWFYFFCRDIHSY